MSLLDCIVKCIPVADIPELIVLFLAGDECLNYCETASQVFKVVHSVEYPHGVETYLDKDCKILHSFNGQPARVFYGHKAWYCNGLLHSYNDMPAIDSTYKVWYKHGLVHRDGEKPAVLNETNNVYSLCDRFYRLFIISCKYTWAQNGLITKQSDC